MSANKGQIRFRRIRGRIVPFGAAISTGVVSATAGAIAVGLAPEKSRLSKRASKSSISPGALFGLGVGAQIASGLVSSAGRSVKGAAIGLPASVGLDLLGTSLFAKAAHESSTSRREKLKKFAQYQSIGAGIGWAAFGGSLLADSKVRNKLLTLGRKIITRGR